MRVLPFSMLFVLGCGSGPAAPTGGGSPASSFAGNNLGVLAGSSLGLGKLANVAVSKALDLQGNGGAEVSVTGAWALGDGSVDVVVLALTNVGTHSQCRVSFHASLRTAADTEIEAVTTALLPGSIAATTVFGWTTCLDAGESAFIAAYPLATAFADVARLAITQATSSGSLVTAVPGPKIVATSYTSTCDAYACDIAVTVRNDGNAAARLDPWQAGVALPLDGADAPLAYFGLELPGAATIDLAPGAETVLTGSSYLQGASTKLLVRVLFDEVGP